MPGETEDEMLSRVAMMADGDPQWDLSTNDQEALHYILQRNEKLTAALKEIAEFWGAPNDDAEPCRVIARNAFRLAEGA